ncbi:MAG: hypothetical protein LBB25_00650 [Holosporaceae bacterium]|nr:hypothetical protein [Holosporaceae bacterium]
MNLSEEKSFFVFGNISEKESSLDDLYCSVADALESEGVVASIPEEDVAVVDGAPDDGHAMDEVFLTDEVFASVADCIRSRDGLTKGAGVLKILVASRLCLGIDGKISRSRS